MKQQQRHYLYNPFVLNLLYNHVFYFDALCRYVCQAKAAEGRDAGETLASFSHYNRIVCHELYMIHEAIKAETYRFDPFFYNFEFILYRLWHMHQPQSANVFGCTSNFVCESIFLVALQYYRQQSSRDIRSVMCLLIRRYVERNYACERESLRLMVHSRQQRFINVKHAEEKHLLSEVQNGDCFCMLSYTREHIACLLYLTLLQEFKQDLMIQKADLTETAYLEELSLKLRSYFNTLAHSCISTHSRRTLERIDSADVRLLLSRKGFLLEIEPRTLERVTQDDDEVIEELCAKVLQNESRTALLSLKRRPVDAPLADSVLYVHFTSNRLHYDFIVYRLLFEMRLQQIHSQHCAGDQKQCHLCEYYSFHDHWHDFMQQSQRLNYMRPAQGRNDMNLEVERQQLFHFLEKRFFVEYQRGVILIVYKLLFQLLCLLEQLPEKRNVFTVINLLKLVDTVSLKMSQTDLQERVTSILLNGEEAGDAIHKHSLVNEALEIVLLRLIVDAFDHEKESIDAYERLVFPEQSAEVGRLAFNVCNHLEVLYMAQFEALTQKRAH